MLGLKHTLPSGQTFGLLLPHHRGFLLSTEHLVSFYCCLSVLMKGSTAAEWYGFRFAVHSVQLSVNLLLHSNLKTFIYTDAFSFVEMRLEGDVQKPLSLLTRLWIDLSHQLFIINTSNDVLEADTLIDIYCQHRAQQWAVSVYCDRGGLTLLHCAFTHIGHLRTCRGGKCPPRCTPLSILPRNHTSSPTWPLS